MALKLAITDLGEIPEGQRTLYRERQDGAGYVLDIEGGAVPKASLDEFRQNNIALQKRLQAFANFDPEELATLRAANGQLRADIERGRKDSATESAARLTSAENTVAELRKRLGSLLIDQEVSRAAASLGVLPAAIEDIATRIRGRFRVDDAGRAVAVDGNGITIYGDDGQALSVAGAVRQLKSQAPHLFHNGGGATSNAGGVGTASRTLSNPFQKQTWNLTEQFRLQKNNPSEAERLAAEAGITLSH